MKLDNIVEQLTNDDVKKILKSYDYTGSFFASTKSKRISVSLEQNLYVTYKSPDECIFPFDILRCEMIKYFGCSLDDKFTNPKQCEEFKIDQCRFRSETINITTDCAYYGISNCRNGSKLIIENHKSLSAHGNTNISINNLDNISHIDIILPAAKYKNVTISDCLNIKSFTDIVMDHSSVSNYEIRNIGVRSFKGFNTRVTNLLVIKSIFDNYLFIDELDAHHLDLVLYSKYDNIITLLLNKHCSKIMLFDAELIKTNKTGNTKYIIDILNHYLHEYDETTRSDYLMDCAVELIDAGFPEAAEL